VKERYFDIFIFAVEHDSTCCLIFSAVRLLTSSTEISNFTKFKNCRNEEKKKQWKRTEESTCPYFSNSSFATDVNVFCIICKILKTYSSEYTDIP
jgi:hypothetical protein